MERRTYGICHLKLATGWGRAPDSTRGQVAEGATGVKGAAARGSCGRGFSPDALVPDRRDLSARRRG
ncbi:hypothetical protein GLE_1777 [Lysobacter enzymogenes]|uniref:Uncharacterized protein n=1 Tax=Lysobacter enzymogenes TaxID=69 RepID=A0A0S2DEQ3_LYSEN|nr:hypothetical protein GLE_1777 [Lysobacter enzymogenes]